jgi:ATP-binding cassette subfamily C protein
MTSARSELATALGSCRTALLGVAVFSGLINLLYLTGSFFMLEVYDRVLPSRSVPTLVGLAILALVLYAFQGVLDIVRSRILLRIGRSIDETLSGRVYRILVRLPLIAPAARGIQPMQDLDQVRSFASGVGPAALFDLPWMPLYLGICFLFHPLIGIAATVGGLLLVAITLLTEALMRAPAREATALGGSRTVLAEASRRNAEVLQAMGMTRRLAASWEATNERYLAAHQRTSDITAGLGGLSKVLRMLLQSAILGLGAWLVIHQQATAGIIIASSILTARALAPVELAVSQWRGFVGARQSWHRLRDLLAKIPDDKPRLTLPAPSRSLTVEQVSVMPPGTAKVVAQDVAFRLQAGQGLGIVGPSASGKSSLVRALVGVWLSRGRIQLDGAALDQWTPETLGPHVGYLPQDLELFAGTVADNIARFEAEPDSDKVIAAAQAAGVHELILGLPQGYETEVGEAGSALSAGQRQRIGLARALYGDPFLVVLDEPNSSLDKEGDEALTRAILGVRARGGIVIVIAHRPSALAGVDMILVMRGGRQQAFGPKEVAQAPMVVPTPLRVAGGVS